jgi:hypothetical protein
LLFVFSPYDRFTHNWEWPVGDDLDVATESSNFTSSSLGGPRVQVKILTKNSSAWCCWDKDCGEVTGDFWNCRDLDWVLVPEGR